MIETKKCKDCLSDIPYTEFNLTKKGALKQSCKCCEKRKVAEYRAKNKDAISRNNKRYTDKIKREGVNDTRTSVTCITCGVEKSRECFPTRLTQISNKCKVCTSEYNKKYGESNREHLKDIATIWRNDNREKCRAYALKYSRANAEKIAAYKRHYDKTNKGIVNAATWRRRCRKKSATPAWADHEKIKAFYRTSSELSMLLGEWYNVDHIVPLTSNFVCGLHCESNLRVITRTENLSKNNLWWPDMWEPLPQQEAN